jgi:hypothetical protein
MNYYLRYSPPFLMGLVVGGLTIYSLLIFIIPTLYIPLILVESLGTLELEYLLYSIYPPFIFDRTLRNLRTCPSFRFEIECNIL